MKREEEAEYLKGKEDKKSEAGGREDTRRKDPYGWRIGCPFTSFVLIN